VTKHERRRIGQVLTFLSRERAQTKPDNTVVLSVITGTSVLAFTRVSESAAMALTGLARLLF
jgi:hypothetical protein